MQYLYQFSLPLLDKMAEKITDNNLNCNLVNQKWLFPIILSLKPVYFVVTDEKFWSVSIMTWCQTGDRPLSTPRTTQFSDAWWCHQMETFSALLALYAGNSPVPGEFPTQRPVTRSFDVYFDLRPNRRLSKQSWGWWFETASWPLWRHRNGMYAL